MAKRLTLKFFGEVQGVGLRRKIQLKARALNLKGWVKNDADGTVAVVAEGLDENLKAFLDWCYNGNINVERIIVDEQEATGEYQEFKIEP